MGLWQAQTLDKVLFATCCAMAGLLFPCLASALPLADRSLTMPYLDTIGIDARRLELRSRAVEQPGRFAATSPRSTTTRELAEWSGARLIEVPRNDPPGTYSRPHYALGFRSELMRSWLNGIGVDATACLAPVVRVRTKLSSGGHLSGTLWLSARCDIR